MAAPSVLIATDVLFRDPFARAFDLAALG